MKLDEFATKLRDKQLSDKNKQDEVKKKYREVNKVKKLTATQKIDMVIEYLGIDLEGME